MDALLANVWAVVVAVSVVTVALITGVVALVRGRSGRRVQLPPTRPPAAGRRGGTDVVDRTPPGTPGSPPTLVETGPSAPTVEELEELLRRERPDEAFGRLQRLRSRLARSNSSLGQGLLTLLSRGRLDEDTWEEVEETLLASDLGVEATTELVNALKQQVRIEGVRDEATVRDWLREDLIRIVDPSMDRSLVSTRQVDRAAVILVVGVNGTGKTTTIGKIARVLVAEDRTVVLGAADTFRAAAADQLQTWGERVGVSTVRADRDGADPAAVAFDAVKVANAQLADVVLIDTAGRLHNKANLMAELEKVKRVIEKQSPIDEVLLVLDATTGQNGLVQAEVFSQAVHVTGIVLTKLDGTAKGGIVVGVQRKLGVPVKLVGLGEGPDDLAPFDPAAFVDAILG